STSFTNGGHWALAGREPLPRSSTRQIRQRLRLPEQVAIPGVGLPSPVSYRWDWWTESPPRGPVQTHLEKRPLAVMPLSLTLSLARQAAETWTSAYRAAGGARFS